MLLLLLLSCAPNDSDKGSSGGECFSFPFSFPGNKVLKQLLESPPSPPPEEILSPGFSRRGSLGVFTRSTTLGEVRGKGERGGREGREKGRRKGGGGGRGERGRGKGREGKGGGRRKGGGRFIREGGGEKEEDKGGHVYHAVA